MDIHSIVLYIIDIFLHIFRLVEGFFFYRSLCFLLEIKKNKFLMLVVYLSCTVLCSMIIYPNDFFNVTLDLLYFIAMTLFAFHGTLIQKLAAVAVLYPLGISFNFLTMDIFVQLAQKIGETFYYDVITYLLDAFLHTSALPPASTSARRKPTKCIRVRFPAW